MRSGDPKEKILAWLVEDGYEVTQETPPKEAPLDWVLKVGVKAPFRVTIVIQKARGKKGEVALTLGVVVSDYHQRALQALPVRDKVRILSSLYQDLLLMCPKCITIFQPNILEAKTIAVTRIVYNLDTKQELLDSVRTLTNMFGYIVIKLNNDLGIVNGGHGRGDNIGFI